MARDESGGHEGLQKALKEQRLEFWLDYDGPINQDG